MTKFEQFYTRPDKGNPNRPSELINLVQDVNYNRERLLIGAKEDGWMIDGQKSLIVVHCLGGLIVFSNSTTTILLRCRPFWCLCGFGYLPTKTGLHLHQQQVNFARCSRYRSTSQKSKIHGRSETGTIPVFAFGNDGICSQNALF